MTGRPFLSLADCISFALCIVLSGCSPDQRVQSAEAPTSGTAAEDRHAAEHTNRLAQETSPYLLLHAHNPVDWHPWSSEALAKARQENKVIFLSVGYSSCYWCHVMERESFMDEEIAAYLNEHFVCIKVDREERPDIDAIYMAALQIYNRASGTGRGGGWPMSMFLTPDALPFFGGTYFPARDGDRGATIGFLSLIKRVHQVWSTNADGIQKSAASLTDMVKTELDGRHPAELDSLNREVLATALKTLEQEYDAEFGGFGYHPLISQQPKFPEPSNLVFLLDRSRAKGVSDEDRQRAQRLLVGTLERMAMGGIRDHLGGGFHRYSVDRFWRIPHFEKMLYDNGQLATVYADAYVLTGREDFKRTVEELLEFVLREMTDPRGGFYSALDAESEHEEGKFYRWEKAEVETLLGEKDFAFYAEIYGLVGPPNFEQHYYVLQSSQPSAAIADERGMSETELAERLTPLHQKLLRVRDRRARPLTDTKILTSWNGLMIRGFADAGRGLKNERYLQTARRAADFALNELRTPEGRLRRTYSQGQARLNAYLDDYANLVDGLIACYLSTGERKWLQAADELMSKQIELFWDEKSGGFFFTSDDHESLIARGRDLSDGAEPSGNSISVGNLIYLSQELDKPEYLQMAERTLQSVAGLMQVAPAAAPRMAVALARWLDVHPESGKE